MIGGNILYSIGIRLCCLILGLLFGLLIANILAYFGYDDIFIDNMKLYFDNDKIYKKHFYAVFAIAGFLGGLIDAVALTL